MASYVYRWDDASATALNNAAGCFNNILYACLVTGYGSRTAAGWTRTYSGTNKAVYRPASGNQYYLRVDDTGTTSARVRGYETVSDVDTGTGPFPTDAQISGGLYHHKASGATTVPWVMVANGSAFWFWCDYSNDSTAGQVMFFGDLTNKTYSSDAYHTLLAANASATATSTNMFSLIALLTANIGGHYMPRRYNGSGTSIQVGKHSDQSRTSTTLGGGSLPYPHATDSKLYVAPIWVFQFVSSSDVHIRGQIPGAWAPLHNKPITNMDTYSGTVGTDLAGKTFIALNIYNAGQIHLETSNTW